MNGTPLERTAFNAGFAALETSREADALPLIDRALAAGQGSARLWQVKALLHRALDDLAPAIEAFDRAAAIAPADPVIALGRAHAALEAGRPAAALFDRALGLSNEPRGVIMGQAAALLAERGLAAAVERVEAASAHDPSWLDGYWLVARYRWMARRTSESTLPLRDRIATAPRDLALRRQLILILTHAGLHVEALEAVREARRATGPHPGLDHAEAACLAELGQIGEADAAFARLGTLATPADMVSRVRHELRAGRPAIAARLMEPLLGHPSAGLLLPYAAIAWRQNADPRSAWLEGDPSFIGIYDLAGTLPEMEEIAALLRELHHSGGQPLEQSVRGGTQTDGPLLSRLEPQIRRLRAAIIEAVSAHVARLPPRDMRHPLLAHRIQAPIRFTGSWSVRLTDSGFHTNHVHPERMAQLRLLCVRARKNRGRGAACRLADFGAAAQRARPGARAAAGRGTAGWPPRPVSVLDVAWHVAFRDRRTANRRVRCRASRRLRRRRLGVCHRS